MLLHAPNPKQRAVRSLQEQATGLLARSVALLVVDTEHGPLALATTSLALLSSHPDPRLVLGITGPAGNLVRRGGRFTLSLLSGRQEELADRFRDPILLVNGAPVSASDFIRLDGGLPFLSEALAVFDCTIDEVIKRGDTSVVIADVRPVSVQQGANALLTWKGQLRGARLERGRAGLAVGLAPART